MNEDHKIYLIKFYVSEKQNTLNHHTIGAIEIKPSMNESDNIKI